jgi:hypothetical protein
MHCKGCGRKRSWLNLRYYTSICLEVLKKNISQDNRSPGRDLNPGPPEYDAGMLTTKLRRSVSSARYLIDLFISDFLYFLPCLFLSHSYFFLSFISSSLCFSRLFSFVPQSDLKVIQSREASSVGEWFQHLRPDIFLCPALLLHNIVCREAVTPGRPGRQRSARLRLWNHFLTVAFRCEWMYLMFRWQNLTRVNSLRAATPISASVISNVTI